MFFAFSFVLGWYLVGFGGSGWCWFLFFLCVLIAGWLVGLSVVFVVCYGLGNAKGKCCNATMGVVLVICDCGYLSLVGHYSV